MRLTGLYHAQNRLSCPAAVVQSDSNNVCAGDDQMMLSVLKVIELATYIAAPGAGGMLADWGADVVKI